MSRNKKYFVVTEGSDRAILRTDPVAAKKKKETLEKYAEGKKVHIFIAEKKLED